MNKLINWTELKRWEKIKKICFIVRDKFWFKLSPLFLLRQIQNCAI